MLWKHCPPHLNKPALDSAGGHSQASPAPVLRRGGRPRPVNQMHRELLRAKGGEL